MIKVRIKKKCILLGMLTMTMMLSFGCKKSASVELDPNEVVTEPTKEPTQEPQTEPEQKDEDQEKNDEHENDNPVDQKEHDDLELYELAKESSYIGSEKFQKKVCSQLNVSTIKNVATKKYQTGAQAVIDKLKSKKDYSVENPLMILNPYGMMDGSLYVYFHTEEACLIQYTVHVDDEEIPDYSGSFHGEAMEGASLEHEGVLLGTIPGRKNYIVWKVVDAEGDIIATSCSYVTMPELKKIPLNFTSIDESQKEPVTDGLYVLYGYTKKEKSIQHTLFVDSYGYVRGTIKTGAVTSTPKLISMGDELLYAYTDTKFVTINSCGKLTKSYSLEKYKLYKDYAYNETTGNLMIIASKVDSKTTGDQLVEYNLEEKKETVCINFKKQFSQLYGLYKENLSKDTKKSWIDLNGIQWINDTDLLISAADISSLIRIDQVSVEPTISCIISDADLWKDTEYASLVLLNVGEFKPQVGQGSITLENDDKTLLPGQFYVNLFDPNISGSEIFPEYNWNQRKDINYSEDLNNDESVEEKEKTGTKQVEENDQSSDKKQNSVVHDSKKQDSKKQDSNKQESKKKSSEENQTKQKQAKQNQSQKDIKESEEKQNKEELMEQESNRLEESNVENENKEIHPSYCYQYFVDMNTKTFTLAKMLELPFTKEYGSCSTYKEAIIFCYENEDNSYVFGEEKNDHAIKYQLLENVTVTYVEKITW